MNYLFSIGRIASRGLLLSLEQNVNNLSLSALLVLEFNPQLI